MNEKIVILGGGGHAKVVISIIKKLAHYKLLGYTDIQNKGDILGVKYLGQDEVLKSLYQDGVKYAVIGVGQIKTADNRKKIEKMCKTIGYVLPPIVSPNSIINENVHVGDGTVIMDGVVINSDSSISECSIINTNASIDHDCKIGSFTHIAPGVTLSGEVVVGNEVLIGAGANVIQQVKIVNNTIISAGSTVLKNILKRGIYNGNPAQLVKEF